ncbi:MAG: carbohydrate binding domain-containing protein [Maribacter sp.]|nr:carbohydrate binding domain-containing protein [Maribacter sp.]
MKQVLNQTLKVSFLILTITFLGCNIDDAKLPEVISGFTYTLNEDSGTVTFINISTDARTFSWNFGDGGTSTEINPIKTYANGTYTVTLTALNASGAVATFEDTITISIPNPMVLPITFDNPNVSYNIAVFQGTAFEILDNPDVSGTNDKASKVGAITNSGKVFEGINFDLGTQIDLTTDKTITMNFWADAPVAVLMKLEQGTGADIEVTANHGGTGWEMISFNFNSSNKYVRVTIFVDGPGETAGTFYIDDIKQVASTGGGTCTAETAQSLSAADFNLTFQTDPTASIDSFDAVLTSVSNPDSDNAVNSSCQVGKIDRSGSALFANNQIDLDAKLDFNANAGFKLKVWSPMASTKVLLKLEDQAAAGTFTELEVTTTKTSAWEELTFPFASSESGKYDKIILFFELNTNTTETYYIDDLKLYTEAGGGTEGNLLVNGDFETGDTSGWTFSENNGTFSATNAEAACGSFSGQLVADVDGGNGGASFPFVKQSNIGIGTVMPNSTVTISFDLRGSLSGAGGVFIAEFFSENSTGGTSKSEILGGGALFPTNTWTRYSFTVTTGDDVSGGVSLLLKSECGPVAGCGVDAYFDNVFLGLGTTGGPDCNGTGGGGSGSGNEGNLVTNGDFETGDDSGWDSALAGNSGTFEVTSASAKCDTYSGNIAVSSAQLEVIRQANMGVGTVTANSAITISFDLRGLTGNGGEFIAILFSESTTDGVTKTDILGGGPLTPTDAWTRYTFNTTTGNDVSNGVSLLLQSVCGAVGGCELDAYIDNIFVAMGTTGGPECAGNGTGGGPVPPSLSFDSTSVTVNEDAGTAIFTATLSGDVQGGFTVDYATADGTAVQPDDYTSTSGTLTFAGTDGESHDIVVPIVDDVLAESQENFVVNLSNTAIDINTPQASGRITDNDGGPVSGELTTNGDFETGDISGWTTFVDAQGASFAVSSAQANGGTFSGNLVADFEAGVGGAVDAVVNQANLGVGTVTPNTQYTISFDLFGSLAGDGGVFFAEFFSELAGGGVSKAEILSGGPLFPNSTWTTYTYTVTTGSDVNGGITLQLKSSCGPVPGCLVDAYIDNVTVKLAN